MTTLYLFKTKAGSVYDRTRGKNKRLYVDSKYIIRPHGSFIIHSENDTMYVERLDKHNNTIYKYEMKEEGMYIIGPLFAKLTRKTNKYVKDIDRKMMQTIGKENAHITLRTGLRRPYVFQLRSWKDGTIRYAFNIIVDENALDEHQSQLIMDTLDQLKSVDINRFVMLYMQQGDGEMFFTIDSQFFDIVESLGCYKVSDLETAYRLAMGH